MLFRSTTATFLLCAAVPYASMLQNATPTAQDHYQRASKAYLNQDFETAVTELNRSLAIDPRQPRALRLLGLCQQLLNKLDLAESAFLAASRLTPKDGEAWFYLGRVYYMRNFFDKALTTLQTAEKYSPDDPRIHETLALTFEAQGDVTGAAQAYQAALNLPSDSRRKSTLYANYGVLLLKLDRLTESENALTKAVTLDENSWQARFELAKLYFQTDRLDGALNTLLEAQKRKATGEEQARAWRLLANVYARLSRPDDANRAMAAAEK